MDFLQWLESEKSMKPKVASDTRSHQRRVLKILNTDEITETSLEELNHALEFKDLHRTVKYQLRKAVKLYLEYKNK